MAAGPEPGAPGNGRPHGGRIRLHAAVAYKTRGFNRKAACLLRKPAALARKALGVSPKLSVLAYKTESLGLTPITLKPKTGV